MTIDKEENVTKVERFKEQRRVADRMQAFANAVSNEHRCDKFGASVELKATYKGEYGSSSIFVWPDIVISRMEFEISKDLRSIAQSAAKRAEKDAEEARVAAKAEAEKILQDVDE